MGKYGHFLSRGKQTGYVKQIAILFSKGCLLFSEVFFYILFVIYIYMKAIDIVFLSAFLEYIFYLSVRKQTN